MRISEMKTGSSVEGFFLLKEAAVKQTKDGKPYFSGKVSDSTGEVPLTVWDYTGEVKPEHVGGVVKVRGSISEYRNAPQIIATRIRMKTDADNVDLSTLVPAAPQDTEIMVNEVVRLISSIKDIELAKLCSAMLNKHKAQWLSAPAAMGMHHAFLHGLLMHTSSMMRMADTVASVYPFANRDLILAGCFLHDFGKLSEYEFSALGLMTSMSVKGQLFGHLVMGALEVRDTAVEMKVSKEKVDILCHIILSHHGNPEWGAAVKPACVEAEIVSLLDLMDARAEEYREALENIEMGKMSPNKVAGLDHRVVNHGLS